MSWEETVKFIQANKIANSLTPEVIYSYAWLLLRDDDNVPITPAPHHRLWIELVCRDDIKKLLLIAPPDSAKTTWLVSAYLGCYMGFYPENSIIIGSVDDSTAEKRSLSLRNIVDTPEWREIFGTVLPDPKLKWEQKEWSIAENGKSKRGRLHPTVRSYGTGAGITGSRADFLLGDDLLDINNTRTKGGRITFANWFESMFLSRAKAKVGKTVIIGTAWNADDYYAYIRRKPKGWTMVHVPSLMDNTDGFYADITYGN